MNGRSKARTTAGRLAAVLLAATLVACAAAAGAEARPPNIVLILADDLGYGDLGCYGQKEIQTPHLDRLAAGGMRFTQAYAGSSVCAPARSVLMTGMHNGRGRVRDNLPHGVHLRPEDLTVAELLRAAGYRTGAFGKWSLGDHFEAGAPWRKGFEEFFGYPNQDHAHFYYPHFLWDHDRVLLLPGNRPGAKRQYAPDLMIERALGFIGRVPADARPFFLYFPSTLPHWSEFPRQSPESHAIPSDAPYSNRDWPQVEKNYAPMVTRLDQDVGRVRGVQEARWGYLSPNAVDWNGDGLPDLVLGDITGNVMVCINRGVKVRPSLEAPRPLYCDGFPLHGMWRVRPAVGRMGGRTALVTVDDADRFHLYWRIDDYNVEDAGPLSLDTGVPITASGGPGGLTGRCKLDLFDWDRDGPLDFVIGTCRTNAIPNRTTGYPTPTLGAPRPPATVLFMRNAGTDTQPVFTHAVPFVHATKGPVQMGGLHESGAVGTTLGGGGPNLLATNEVGRFHLLRGENLTTRHATRAENRK